MPVPQVEPGVREHFDDPDELLLYRLMAAVWFFHAGDLAVEQRLICFIELALRHGDAAV